MKSTLAIVLMMCSLCCDRLFGQQSSGLPGPANVETVANASSTGTTVNTLTKLTGAPSTAVIAATTDTGGIIGIVIAGAGTSGIATIQKSGLVSCVFSNATTAGDYVQISSATAGNCVDTGAATYPTSGQVIGRVLSTNGSAGTYQIDLFPAEIKAASGGGSGAVTNITSSITWTGCTVSGGVCSPGSAVASLTGASIPSSYNAIRFVMRGHSSGSNDTGVIAQFNSDTTAGDYTCAFGGYSAGNLLTTCAAVSINFAYVTCISISGDSMGGGSFEIPGYASVTKQVATGTCARQYSAGLSSFLVTNFWQPGTAAAINTIKLFLTGGDNFSTDVTVSVYGIN